MAPFHLAFPVDDLYAAREFYVNVLGCSLGRASDKWIDFNFYGHQIVAHLSPKSKQLIHKNDVDGNQVPGFHFGLILPWNAWESLIQQIAESDVDFMIEPKIRFKNKAGEQGTFFILDPSGNALEFKSFKDNNEIFRIKGSKVKRNVAKKKS